MSTATAQPSSQAQATETVNPAIRAQLQQWFDLPFFDLVNKAHQTHKKHFNPQQVQLSTLLSIKTGACPEDCSYCPQSAHYTTDAPKEQLMAINEVVDAAKQAKATGATRFCMGAAWRSPNKQNLETVKGMIQGVKALGMETCVTLGMLDDEQAQQLKAAGLDYYNHNLDTSEDYYGDIITTRTYGDRLNTLAAVRDAGINVCCGGIVGMGETTHDRLELLATLASLPTPPESVPLNMLIPIPGTPLAGTEPVDPFEFVRLVAVARLAMPTSAVRLSAGREDMDDTMQAWCFFAGANSIFYGDTLLTAENPIPVKDKQLFERLNIEPTPA
jgi:biotin synthase